MSALVYIAGPYTHPDPVINTRAAIEAGMRLYDARLGVPIIPHLSMLSHFVSPRPLDYWYQFDLALLSRCDVLWRIPGESTGADAEVKFARENGLAVVESFEALRAVLCA